MKPLIGITLHEEEEHFSLNIAYARCIALAGGVPLLLPHGTIISVEDTIRYLSGLVLSGGGDIDPLFFGEEPLPGLGKIYPERDTWEIELCQRFLKDNKPILGICRGIQVLNVAAGGSLWQTLPLDSFKHMQDAPKNHTTHGITISQDSHIAKITSLKKARINSFHQQAVQVLAPGFQATCLSGDNIIEAIESEDHSFAVGVQWHPEHLWDLDESKALFVAFIAACKKIH
jgi:putative glutamine amidotransferase